MSLDFNAYDNNLVVTGLSSSFTSGNYDILIAGFDRNTLSLEWARTVGASGDDRGYNIMSKSGSSIEGVFVLGYTDNWGAGGRDVFLMGFSPYGENCIGTSVSLTVSNVTPTVGMGPNSVSISPSTTSPSPSVSSVTPSVSNVCP